jgi:hypothetical protein
MSTAQDIVTDAMGMLTLMDINELAPSPVEMSKGVRALGQMIDSWATQGFSIKDQTRTCAIDGSTNLITNPLDALTGLPDVSQLAVGMNINGVGIPASTRIKTINDVSRQITLDQKTTIAGAAVTVTFQALPFEAKFERGVAALLALEIAPLFGEDNIPAYVVKMASDGWHALCGNFCRTSPVAFDPMLSQTSTRRTTVIQP